MNSRTKTRIMATGVVSLLAGCAQMAERQCSDTVTVDYREAFLHARPPLAQVCRGGTLTVVFRPIGKDRGKPAHTAPGPQNGKAAWLRGSSPTGDRIVLDIDEEVPIGEYKYDITVDGIGTLDPRVRVMK